MIAKLFKIFLKMSQKIASGFLKYGLMFAEMLN